MMKGPHSCASATGPHRVSSCNAAPMNQAAARPRGEREGGGSYNPRYARYLLFCSFGDAFINQTPSPRRSSSAFFKPCGNTRHAATGGRAVLRSFFLHLRFRPFFCLVTPCAPRTNAPRRSGNPKATGFRQSHSAYLQQIRFFERNLSCHDAKLKYCFTRQRSSILDPRVVLRITSTFPEKVSS